MTDSENRDSLWNQMTHLVELYFREVEMKEKIVQIEMHYRFLVFCTLGPVKMSSK